MKAVITAFHNYCSMYNHKYFDPIYSYFMRNFRKWESEVDKLYILDSNWGARSEHSKVEIIKTDPNMRYYDTYKWFVPQVKEKELLFLDNDMVIWQKDIVRNSFDKLKDFDVVSIYDTIGEWNFDQLSGKSKFCPYFFMTTKKLLEQYLDCEWGPNLPLHETLGMLTKRMLDDGVKPYEAEEDKSSYYFDKHFDQPKKLGYYHIRAGSTPAYLLTHFYCGNKETCESYMDNQPRQEILRHFAWYWLMANPRIQRDVMELLRISFAMPVGPWREYIEEFKEYHGIDN